MSMYEMLGARSEGAPDRKQQILNEWRQNGTFPYSDERNKKKDEMGRTLQPGSHAKEFDTMSTASTLGPNSEIEPKKKHQSLREKLKSLRGPTKEEAQNMTPEELVEANKNKITMPIVGGYSGVF